jgi:malonyl-CoA O-methyltransferase
MAERLGYIRLDAARVLDAGCGTGAGIPALRQRFPAATVIALDWALPMAMEVRRRYAAPASWLRALLPGSGRIAGAPVQSICADLAALPFAARSIDLAWSNLALPWCADPGPPIVEIGRVLRIGGLLMFSTLGPDTLKELRESFASVDPHPRVHRFPDMHDIGDLLVASGFVDPVMDMEMLTLTYEEPETIVRDLRASGSRNAAAGRLRGLTTPRRWRAMLEALDRVRSGDRIGVTFEVVYGHAWKAEPRRTPEGHAIVRFPSPRAR